MSKLLQNEANRIEEGISKVIEQLEKLMTDSESCQLHLQSDFLFEINAGIEHLTHIISK